MAKAKLYSKDGAEKGEYELPESHFGQEVNEALMHQAVVIYLGNQRQGTHKSKSRAEVSGSTKKPWKQKGTGRARAGSNTSPIWVRGSKAHGPKPRDYRRDINHKMRKRALVSALSFQAQQEAVKVFEALEVSEPKTKQFVSLLKNAALEGKKNLVLVSELEHNLMLATRNLPTTQVQQVKDINTYMILNAANVIFTDSAVKALAEA